MDAPARPAAISRRHLQFDAEPDSPDVRDLYYTPSIRPMPVRVDPRADRKRGWWSPALVRDQGSDPSCTAHAVAAAIDMLIERERVGNGGTSPRPLVVRHGVPFASAVMLYGNARLHDELPGERYRGTSLRGTLKGFQHNGVAYEGDDLDFARDPDGEAWRWHAQKAVLEQARDTTLGQYLRVETRLDDFHAALSEVGVVVVTARIHERWFDAADTIPFDPSHPAPGPERIHAFVVIGFTHEGFVVQNSWGTLWGDRGTAVWQYADWAANVFDAWVMKLGIHASAAFQYSFGPQGYAALVEAERIRTRRPTRLDVMGHFVPIEGGRLLARGRFHAGREDIKRIAERIKTERDEAGQLRYGHVLLLFMSGVRSCEDAARAVRTLHPVYTAAGIYPLFFSWETRMLRAVTREVERVLAEVAAEVGPHSVRNPLAARLVEGQVADIPLRMRGALLGSLDGFLATTDLADPNHTSGGDVLALVFGILASRLADGSLSAHVFAHDIAAHVALRIVAAPKGDWGAPVFSSVHLSAPLVARGAFVRDLLPLVARRGEGRANRKARRDAAVVERVRLYCLDDSIAAGDMFGAAYPRSWPDLWARAEPFAPGRPRNGAIDQTPDGARTRLLALMPYTLEALAEAEAVGADVEAFAVGDSAVSDLGRLTHFDMDACDPVTRAVIATIGGRTAAPGGEPLRQLHVERGERS